MVQNQLKAETQIMSLLWKTEDSGVSGDDRSNWHTYPDSEREAEHEVREQNPPSIVPPFVPFTLSLLEGATHVQGVLHLQLLSLTSVSKWQMLLSFIWYA